MKLRERIANLDPQGMVAIETNRNCAAQFVGTKLSEYFQSQSGA